jgi:hypothetical protein
MIIFYVKLNPVSSFAAVLSLNAAAKLLAQVDFLPPLWGDARVLSYFW